MTPSFCNLFWMINPLGPKVNGSRFFLCLYEIISVIHILLQTELMQLFVEECILFVIYFINKFIWTSPTVTVLSATWSSTFSPSVPGWSLHTAMISVRDVCLPNSSSDRLRLSDWLLRSHKAHFPLEKKKKFPLNVNYLDKLSTVHWLSIVLLLMIYVTSNGWIIISVNILIWEFYSKAWRSAVSSISISLLICTSLVHLYRLRLSPLRGCTGHRSNNLLGWFHLKSNWFCESFEKFTKYWYLDSFWFWKALYQYFTTLYRVKTPTMETTGLMDRSNL